MSKHEPFRNPYPRVYGESAERRAQFDKIAGDLKNRYAEQGKHITDNAAVEAARNLIAYVELVMEITERNLREGKIPPEEIEAAQKRAVEMRLLTGDDKKPKRKNIPAPETTS